MSIKPGGENLIFLISQPRAGSTMLQRVLSGNSEIATTSEPWIALHPTFSLKDNTIDQVYGSDNAKNALLEFLKESGVDIKFFKNQINIFLTSLYNQSIKHQGKKYFLDKTPRYYLIIDELYELFPKAKFVILFRNPMAILNSVITTWVKDDYSLIVNNLDDFFEAPKKLISFCEKKHSNCYRVHYEDIVAKPGYTIRKICNFLEIGYSERMLQYGEKNWKYGDQTGLKKYSHPSEDSLDNWKNEILKKHITRQLALYYIYTLGEQLVTEMGYDFNELKNSIDSVDNSSQSNIAAWSNAVEIIEGLNSLKNVKRIAFSSLIEDDFFPNEFAISKKTYKKIFKDISTNQLHRKITFLKLNNRRLTKKISNMENTLSWKITSPIRNSKILSVLLSFMKKFGLYRKKV